MSSPEAVGKFRFGELLASMALNRRQTIDMAKTMVQMASNLHDPKFIKEALEQYNALVMGREIEDVKAKEVEFFNSIFEEK